MGDSLLLQITSFLPPGWGSESSDSGIIVAPDTLTISIVNDGQADIEDTARVIVHAINSDGEYAGCTEAAVYFSIICGDADANDIVNISDAVYLITHILGGGQSQSRC